MQTNTAPTINEFSQLFYTSMQWANSSSFYSCVPAQYRTFYDRWVRNWLQWADGYVPDVHGAFKGMLSTKIGSAIVKGAVKSTFAGGLMFTNSDVPKLRDTVTNASVALNFISDDWAKKVKLRSILKQAGSMAFSGGSALLKINPTMYNGLWVDCHRMDRFVVDVGMRGCIDRAQVFMNAYHKMAGNETTGRYYLMEDRYFVDVSPLRRHMPVVEYSVYSGGSAGEFVCDKHSKLDWNNIPKGIRESIQKDYGAMRVNEPQALPFDDLGVYLLKASEGIDNYPGSPFGQSILHNVMTYLYLFDYCYSCMGTDMYAGRGKVLLNKLMSKTKDGKDVSGNQFAGLDSFIYQAVPHLTTEEQKPVSIQFDLRATEWRDIRNQLLEAIATNTGLSVGSFASYINDASNRTAREVSSEESSTTAFVEDARGMFGDAFDELLRTVCKYYGYVDMVSVRWSMAGQTNVTAHTENVMRQYQGGTKSLESSVKDLNPDYDEDQVKREITMIQSEQAAKQTMASNSLFGDIDLNGGNNGTEVFNAGQKEGV